MIVNENIKVKKEAIYSSANLVMHYLLQSIFTRQRWRWSNATMIKSDENERKITYSLIVKDEEQNESWCKRWNDESSLAQYDASTAEDDARLNSSCNHAFLWSSTCICKHARWEHDMCESLLHSDNECSDNIRSSDHYDLSCISNYQNMQK